MGRGCVLVCFGGCPCPSYNIHCHKEYDTGNNTRQPLSETISTIPPARAVPRVLTVPVVSQGARTLVDARMRQPAAIRCRRLRIGCGSDIAPRCLRNGAVRHPAIRLHAQSSGCARPVAALRCPPVSPASLWQAAAQARRGRSGRVRLAEKSARFRPGSPGTLPPPPPQRGQGGGNALHVSDPLCPGALQQGWSPGWRRRVPPRQAVASLAEWAWNPWIGADAHAWTVACRAATLGRRFSLRTARVNRW